MFVKSVDSKAVYYKISVSLISEQEYILYETIRDINGHDWIVEEVEQMQTYCQYLVTTIHGDKDYTLKLC